MKKAIRLVVLLSLVAAVICVPFLVLGAATTPEVIFDAGNDTFSFNNVVYGPERSAEPTDADPYPDIFQISSAMPGDSESWQVRVTVKNAGNKTVKMYVRAENANEGYRALFGEEGEGPATLSATFAEGDRSVATKIRRLITGEEPDAATYTGYIDEGAAYLGAYSGNNSSKDIDLTFSIPLSAGNEIAGLSAEVDWVFQAEVIEDDNDHPHPRPDHGGSGGNGGSDGPALNKEDHFAYVIGYPDATVRPGADISRAEIATILFRLLTDESRNRYWSTANAFSDVPSTAWYNTAISTLAQAGVVNGYPDGSFKPDRPVTRAEFAALFSRFFSASVTATVSFNDIRGHWAEEVILNAASRGYIYGYPNGSFGPNRPITRAEAMALTNRVLERKPHKDHLLPDMIHWIDNADKEVWYYADVQEASNSHEYAWITQTVDNGYENWLEILPTRDWAALEQQWKADNADKQSAQVYTSQQ
ncbi:MAG: S-layer homology domain-containing protein [Firmicutes bacterium]|nr:S-layer homology domain-containing protein [Bacillota bacterium]